VRAGWFAGINLSKPTPTTNPALRDRSKERPLSALVSDVTAFLGTAAPVRSRESCGKTPHHTLDLTTCWWSASTRRHAAASGHLPHLCPGGFKSGKSPYGLSIFKNSFRNADMYYFSMTQLFSSEISAKD